MKFFTIAWWAGEIEDDHMEVFNRYREHIDRISPDLEEDHRRLVNEVSLHDSCLLALSGDFSEASVVLTLDGSGYDESTKAYFQRSFELCYDDVQFIGSTANPEIGLPGPHGFGDLGYDELDILEPGLYEHRMLFSTGIVLRIRHSRFTLRFEDTTPNNADSGRSKD